MKNTIFDALTDSRATLGAFLRSLPVLEAPWDTEFQKRFCSECDAANCDHCENEEFRNNPEWWLTLEENCTAGDKRRVEIRAEQCEGCALYLADKERRERERNT